MKAIILAGGYGRRLLPLTENCPKSLLIVGGKEIIWRTIEKVQELKEIDEIVISTNEKWKPHFDEFIVDRVIKKPIKLVVEPTLKEGEKLGSIGGLNFIIDHLSLDENVMVLGGDNIFEFSLQDFMDYHKDRDISAIALKKITDKELIKKYGVCVLDKDGRIVEFQEKPSKPKSDLASTACYIFNIDDFMAIKDYLAEGNPVDHIGDFIAWLVERKEIYGYSFREEWYDIGGIKQLEEARKRYGD